MLAAFLALFRRDPDAAPQEQRKPFRHELLEQGFKDPVLHFSLGRWVAEERSLADHHDMEYEEPPEYGW